jgi:hypothetical protein
MKPTTLLAFAIVGLILAVPAAAHHSRPVFYDMEKKITVTGVLTDAKIVNPHSTFYFEVTEPDGQKAKWVGTTASGAALVRAGWSKDTIKAGTTVVFEGNPARDASAKGMLIDSFTLPDGKKIVVQND